jgi:hypothetical protein
MYKRPLLQLDGVRSVLQHPLPHWALPMPAYNTLSDRCLQPYHTRRPV